MPSNHALNRELLAPILNPFSLGEHWQNLLVWAGAGLDALFGLLSLCTHRRKIWLAQLGLVTGYGILLTVFAPVHWLHPFGPVLKNIPIMAMLIWLILDAPNTLKTTPKKIAFKTTSRKPHA